MKARPEVVNVDRMNRLATFRNDSRASWFELIQLFIIAIFVLADISKYVRFLDGTIPLRAHVSLVVNICRAWFVFDALLVLVTSLLGKNSDEEGQPDKVKRARKVWVWTMFSRISLWSFLPLFDHCDFFVLSWCCGDSVP